MIFSHLLDVAVPTPFVTELPPTKTGQHLDMEQIKDKNMQENQEDFYINRTEIQSFINKRILR